MKSLNFIFAVIVAVGTAMPVTTGLAAQDETAQAKTAQHHHYKLIDLGTFGGPTSRNGDIWPPLNISSTVIGGADTNDPDPLYPNFNPLILPG